MLDFPDVRKLRVLREVASRGTIAAAADALGMTASAASQQLASLERQAGGVELVVRTGRSVTLTPTALRLVEHTERVLEHLEAARIDLSTDPEDISGELHLASFATGIGALVAPALPVLRERYPRLDVAVIERDPENALPALATGTIDLALIADYDLLPSIAPVGASLEVLLEEPMRLVLPDRLAPRAGEGVSLADLAGERWIAASAGTSCNLFVHRACHQAGFDPQIWGLSGDYGVIIKLVAAGAGVALIPSIAQTTLPPGVVIADLDQRAVRRIHIATRAGSQHHPGVSAVVEELRHAASTLSLEMAIAAPALTPPHEALES
jgi:DNA-binding transcriptional LysR family regulator